MNLKILLAALLIALLAACGSNTTDTQPPSAQLSEAETNQSFNDLRGELLGMVLSMNGDVSSVALQNLPIDAANFPLAGASEEMQALPRGRYTYDAASDSWQQSDDDDLILVWSYDDLSASDVEATLTLDWDAGAQTVNVAEPDGETFEAPTSFNITVVAAGQKVADVDVALSYYNSEVCGAIAEPTSLSVNGTGSLLDLENVGYNSQEGAVTTQGKVTLNHQEDVTLEWAVSLAGERERAECFTSDYAPTSGSVNVGLAADAGSFALEVDVDSVDVTSGSATLSNGVLQINNQVAVNFAGTLDDANGNGVPGENVTLSLADEKTLTLEQVLQSSKIAMMVRGLGLGR